MLDDKDMNMQGQHEEPSVDKGPEANQEPAALAQDPVMELPEIPVASAQAAPALMYEPGQEQPRKPAGKGWKMAVAAVALVAVGAGVGSATTWGLAKQMTQNMLPIGMTLSSQSTTKTVSDGAAAAGINVIPDIYRRVSPTVVKIDVQASRGASASGSGFVVDTKGYILTNNHVIEGGSKITVKFVDGTTLPGKVVGADKLRDLAVVKVDPGTRGLVAAALGDSDKVEVGELAVAIGSPFGNEFTVTSGIVSALNRDLSEENNPWIIPGGIQTDASINPGNSGGPLFNANGEVIGINTLIDSPNRANVGIGFAIPINTAKELLPKLISGAQIEYGYLGIGMQTLDANTAKRLNMTTTEGVIVTEVAEGSPAEKAGLQPAAVTQGGRLLSADVIVAIDNTPIKTKEQVLKVIQSHKAGDAITLTVMRGKDKVTINATLSNRPADDQ